MDCRSSQQILHSEEHRLEELYGAKYLVDGAVVDGVRSHVGVCGSFGRGRFR